MKKILALVLALAMVLGMATIVSAGDPTVKVNEWSHHYLELKVTADEEFGYIEIKGNLPSCDVTIDYDDIPATGIISGSVDPDITKMFVVVYDTDGEELVTYTFSKPESDAVVLDVAVISAMLDAIVNNKDTVTIDLYDVYDNTITGEDWAWMLNANKFINDNTGVAFRMPNGQVFNLEDYIGIGGPIGGSIPEEYLNKFYNLFTWWNDPENLLSKYTGFDYSYGYLNMNFKIVDVTTVFYIDAADIDYTWNKDICFDIDDGLTYDDYTKAEIFAAIRKLSGDTKNPYTFGFSTPSKVPTMTVSYVIPQQWINVYGHKDLALWAYTNVEETCDACGAKHEEFKVLNTTTLDAVTQTQRIEFTTNEFYRTLVLSKTAASTATDTKTDANPNTGANDIVNVAIVFSVISLVAAGAFVFSKQR